MLEGKIILSCEPQDIEGVGGVILTDNLGKRSVFTPKPKKGYRRKNYSGNSRCLTRWAENFRREARGRITAHTYSRVNGTTTIHPVSEELRQMLLGDD